MRAGRSIAILLAAWLVDGAVPRDARAETRFLKGPYLMDARPTSMAILFEPSEEAAAVVVVRRTEDGAEVARIEAPPNDFHEIVIEGLAPATEHRWRVGLVDASGGGASATGRFVTAPEPGRGPIRFLVVGDNRSDAVAHAAIVRAMRAASDGTEMIINTGDMVANGTVPEDWQRMFDIERPLLRELPLFPTLGNHERYHYGHGIPSYLRYARVPDELGGAETYYGFTWGPVRFVVLDSNDDWSDAELPQRRWLERVLEEATGETEIRHVMVVLHHGPMSSGHHGNHPDLLSMGVVGVFRDREVSLVLSGHDHDYERGDAIGVKYIVSGGGGAPLYEENDPLPYQQSFEAVHHFLTVEVDGDRVEVVARRIDGSILEQCGFRGRRGMWRCEVALPPPARSVLDRASMPWLAAAGGAGLLVAVGVAVVSLRRRRSGGSAAGRGASRRARARR